MPRVRKLTPEEVEAIERNGESEQALVREQYDQLVADFVVGDYVEVDLDPDDNRLIVAHRLKRAAQRRGLKVQFIPTRGAMMRLRVVPGGGYSFSEKELD